MTTQEQLTLDLPPATDHGVVVSINNKVVKRVSGLSSEGAARNNAQAIQRYHQNVEGVIFDAEPKTTGWYGLKDGHVYTIAVY